MLLVNLYQKVYQPDSNSKHEKNVLLCLRHKTVEHLQHKSKTNTKYLGYILFYNNTNNLTDECTVGFIKSYSIKAIQMCEVSALYAKLYELIFTVQKTAKKS